MYVFTNQGNNQFEQALHLPLNGAYNAVPADFDLDGDLDIAAISFFPDYQGQPLESFVFYEQQDGQFTPRTFANNQRGRWIVMDAADPDRDGDLDLVLGSLAFEVVPPNGLVEKWVKGGLGFVVLRNEARKSSYGR